MIVLDANVLIAHLEAGHPHGVRAGEILALEDDLAIHPLTLAECLVGAVRTGREQDVQDAVEQLEIAEWQPPLAAAYSLAHIRVDTGLKMPDCCVILAASFLRADVATFDHGLAEEARKLGLAVYGLDRMRK